MVAAEQVAIPDASEEKIKPKKLDCTAKLKQILSGGSRVAIFTHSGPDPDAIGSIMGLCWVSSKMGIECHAFYQGSISHPQNIAVVNLLDPDMRSIEEYKKEDFDVHILVDTIPSNAGIGELNVEFDVVIDHHKDTPNGFNGLYINLKAGCACSTVYHLIREMGYEFEENNDLDTRVATALMVGMVTDTEYLMADDTTEFEFRAWSDLFSYRNPNALRRIVNYERPRAWITQEAAAINNVVIDEGVGIVGLGSISSKNRDMIPDLAAQMVTWEGCHTAVVFAIVEGDRVEGSVRSNNASVMVPSLCKSLGGKHGQGGGKLGKGAYRYELAGAGIEDGEDEEIAAATWELVNKREIRRINKVMNDK